jgi:hypothetical protein
VHGEVVVAQPKPPGFDVTVYPMIGEPPFELGAVHETTAEASPTEEITTLIGASGTVNGVTAADAVDAEPAPDAFVALTVKVYEVPFVRPVTVQLVVTVVQVNEPGDDVTV